MSNSVNILAVGANPLVAFYVSRLATLGTVSVSVVVEESTPNSEITWKSKDYGNTRFQPTIYLSAAEVARQPTRYDCLLMSAKSLQDISMVVSQYASVLSTNATIIVESTGYVKLEGFITLSLPPALSGVQVLSIMCEHNVRRTGPMSFLHTTSATANTYLGRAESRSDAYDSNTTALIYEWANLLEACGVRVSIPKTTTDFLGAQMRLCVPRAVFDPLAIVLEIPYPADFDAQILSKPLISGLIDELTRLAKAFKTPSLPTEAALYQQWCQRYKQPQDAREDQYLTSSPLFYDFYHQRVLEVDLLLLQPILLADDFNIRTPYLEFLYAMLCQYLKLNAGHSTIFVRGTGTQSLDRLLTAQLQLQRQQAQISNLQAELDSASKEREDLKAIEAKRVQEMTKRISLADRPRSNDMSDLREIALYGALLNGETQQQQQPYPLPLSSTPATLAGSDEEVNRALADREAELAKRERALAARETELRRQLQQQAASLSQGVPPQAPAGPVHGNPPQGYPGQGHPTQGPPLTMRSASYTSMPQGPPHPVQRQQTQPPPSGRRLMSLGGMPSYANQPPHQPPLDGRGGLLSTVGIDSEIESRFRQKGKTNRRSAFPGLVPLEGHGGPFRARPQQRSGGMPLTSQGMPSMVASLSSTNLAGQRHAARSLYPGNGSHTGAQGYPQPHGSAQNTAMYQGQQLNGVPPAGSGGYRTPPLAMNGINSGAGNGPVMKGKPFMGGSPNFRYGNGSDPNINQNQSQSLQQRQGQSPNQRPIPNQGQNLSQSYIAVQGQGYNQGPSQSQSEDAHSSSAKPGHIPTIQTGYDESDTPLANSTLASEASKIPSHPSKVTEMVSVAINPEGPKEEKKKKRGFFGKRKK